MNGGKIKKNWSPEFPEQKTCPHHGEGGGDISFKGTLVVGKGFVPKREFLLTEMLKGCHFLGRNIQLGTKGQQFPNLEP